MRCTHTRIARRCAEHFLTAQKLIIFCNVLRAGWCAILIASSVSETDLNIQIMNVLGNNISSGIGGAIYVGILSALYKKNLKAGLAVVGNITIGGAVEKVLQFADKVSSLAENGAKMVIVPMDNIAELATVPTTVLSKCDVPFYNNAQVLLQKALE